MRETLHALSPPWRAWLTWPAGPLLGFSLQFAVAAQSGSEEFCGRGWSSENGGTWFMDISPRGWADPFHGTSGGNVKYCNVHAAWVPNERHNFEWNRTRDPNKFSNY